MAQAQHQALAQGPLRVCALAAAQYKRENPQTQGAGQFFAQPGTQAEQQGIPPERVAFIQPGFAEYAGLHQPII